MKRVWIIFVAACILARPIIAEELEVKDLVGVDWYGLYINGQKAGYSRNEVAVTDDGTVTISEDASFALTMAASRQDMRFKTVRVYSAAGELVRIDSEVEDLKGHSRFLAENEADGLHLTSVVGGEENRKVLPKPTESLTDALKHAHWIRQHPAEGDSMAFKAFDPMYEQEMTGMSHIVDTEVRILDGVPTTVYKIKSTIDSAVMQLDSISFVTQDGTTLEDEVAGMLTMRLENEDDAKDVDYSNDVIVSNAAMVDAPIEKPRSREKLTLRLTGPLNADHVFNDERQYFRQEGDNWIFTSNTIQVNESEAVNVPVQDEDAKKYLAPTTFVQSDNPAIIAKAREIAGEETNTLRISNALCEWVHANMRSTFSARLTNALEVLNSLEGDCTEHSILFIALCRAAGVPAREVAGLIYVEGSQPGFYFHQWAKVWIGKWIDVDPTFNQPLADVTHIKLAEGDIFRQTKIIPIIGKLSVEVLPDAPVLAGP